MLAHNSFAILPTIMPELDILKQTLGISFSTKSLLEQALVHSSAVNENPELPLSSNERLEFLGDAVLNFIVTNILYREFPDLPEGELTKIRTSLICRETLARLATSLKLGDYLYLGRGEELSGGRKKPSNLANALEAVIGAIFLDQGLASATDLVSKLLSSELQKIKERGVTPNYKTILQEYTQAQYQQTPVYHLIEATGPDHDRSFTVEVLLGDRILGRGSGKSKQSAEMAAARTAWEKLRCQR